MIVAIWNGDTPFDSLIFYGAVLFIGFLALVAAQGLLMELWHFLRGGTFFGQDGSYRGTPVDRSQRPTRRELKAGRPLYPARPEDVWVARDGKWRAKSPEIVATWELIWATKPSGWFLGRPVYDEHRKPPAWVMEAVTDPERPVVGRRMPKWKAIGTTEEACLQEMARGLRELSEGRAPK